MTFGDSSSGPSVRHDVPLRDANSFRVQSIAEEFVEVRDDDELLGALVQAQRESVPVTLLGGGTNVVMLERIEGRVIRIASRGIAFDADEDGMRVTAAGGENWHGLVRACLGRGLSGLENLALIPGTVGAAPIQNIGAYGVELSALVIGTTVIDTRTMRPTILDAATCAFRYRDSVFKSDEPGRYVVTGLVLRLGGQELETGYRDVGAELRRMGYRMGSRTGRGVSPQLVAEAVIRVRRRKLPDPRRTGNAGSTFKNPTLSAGRLDRLRAHLDIDAFPAGSQFKVPAARLVEAAGWKGYRRGDAGVWPRHALVLVNYGGATGRQILDLARRIADDIAHRFEVELDLEPQVLGRDGGPRGRVPLASGTSP